MRNRRVAVLATLSLSTFAVAVPATAAVHATAAKRSEFKFTLSTHKVKHGKVKFTIKNKGSVTHDFSIAGHTSKKVGPGKSTTLTVTLKKGKAAYKCTVPGHGAAGMKGT